MGQDFFDRQFISTVQYYTITKPVMHRGASPTKPLDPLDLMPTILNLTDTQAPEGYILDGYDLRAVHAGETKQTFLMHFPHKHRSSYFTTWHNGDWKLIYQYHSEPRLQLFNLAKDRSERNDLAEQNPELLQGMLSEMNNALKDSGALFPVSQKLGESAQPYLN